MELEDLSTNHLLNLIKENRKKMEDLYYQNIGFNDVLEKRSNK